MSQDSGVKALRQWLMATSVLLPGNLRPPNMENEDTWYSSRDTERVARQLNISHEYFSAIVQGRRAPSKDTAERLETLGGPPATLWESARYIADQRIGIYFKNWIASNGYTIRSFAKNLDVSEAIVKNWIAGISVPDKGRREFIEEFGGPSADAWHAGKVQIARGLNEPLVPPPPEPKYDVPGVPPLLPTATELAEHALMLDVQYATGECHCLSHRIHRAAPDYEELPWQSRQYVILNNYKVASQPCCVEQVREQGPVERRDIAILFTERPDHCSLELWFDHLAWFQISRKLHAKRTIPQGECPE